MRNVLGPPVIGDDFFGREAELSSAWAELEAGNHLLLSAPRRVGKTSFVRRIEEDADQKDWKGIYVNVEDKDSEIGFVQAIAEKLQEKKGNWLSRTGGQAREKLGKIIESVQVEIKAENVGSMIVKWNDPNASVDVKQNIHNLLRALDIGLIIIDELPVLLNRIAKEEDGTQRVADFLHWLRSLRQLPDVNVRWVFCGSIGLDSFTERLGLTKTVNDLYAFKVGAFTNEVANNFLVKMGADNGFHLTPAVRNELISQVGWPLPYYLQLLFNKLRAVCRSKSQIGAGTDDLPAAFEQAAVHSNLGTWMERLDEQLPPADARLAKALLDNLSKKPAGAKRNSLEQQLLKLQVAPDVVKDKATKLLKMLERDGYLLSQDGLYAFRSPLLRLYWYNSRIL